MPGRASLASELGILWTASHPTSCIDYTRPPAIRIPPNGPCICFSLIAAGKSEAPIGVFKTTPGAGIRTAAILKHVLRPYPRDCRESFRVPQVPEDSCRKIRSNGRSYSLTTEEWKVTRPVCQLMDLIAGSEMASYRDRVHRRGHHEKPLALFIFKTKQARSTTAVSPPATTSTRMKAAHASFSAAKMQTDPQQTKLRDLSSTQVDQNDAASDSPSLQIGLSVAVVQERFGLAVVLLVPPLVLQLFVIDFLAVLHYKRSPLVTSKMYVSATIGLLMWCRTARKSTPNSWRTRGGTRSGSETESDVYPLQGGTCVVLGSQRS